MKTLSIIVPCYYEEESLPLFYKATEEVNQQLENIKFEYWFINDGSTDGTLAEMRKLNELDSENVHYVSFRETLAKRPHFTVACSKLRAIMSR